MASAQLEAALTRIGPTAPRSQAGYYLGLAYWKLGRLPETRLHVEAFLEHLTGRDRHSLAAPEAARVLASIDQEPIAGTMEALVPSLVCCGGVVGLQVRTGLIGRGH